ncbi:hypothetical protein, conserved [Eimeria brunetti]|uniref:Transmembrane protein n=1 Tax=Eimeria brunetti TaxID=51314 RepID=U6LQX6_9EIME|nr:hypothetical protein, conserved [Eimeria brunetti]
MENEVSVIIPQVSSSFLDQAAGKPVASPDGLTNARLRSQKRSPLASLAAATIIIAILMILSVCVAARNREQVEGVARRRLSYSDEETDEVEQSVLDGCLALEAELGILRAEEPSYSHGDRSTRIAQLVSLFSKTAVAFESMQHRTRGSMQAMQGPSDGKELHCMHPPEARETYFQHWTPMLG